ncbi:MAG: phosphoglycerate dehydrogenase [Acidobacteriota bacterium]
MGERVLVADGLEEAGLAILREAGLPYDIKTGLSAQELATTLGEGGYTALVVRSASRATRDVIAAGRALRIIGRAGVGVDNIDVAAASERGVLVVNTPEGNTIAAAEHTVALMLALARNVPDAHRVTREGKWDRKSYMGVELAGKTLGVVGLGKIGRAVAARARSFGLTVVGYDPFVSSDLCQAMGVAPMSLPDVIGSADFLTLHVPLTEETRGILDRAALARCKRGVRIVNCARGGLVDEAALAEALASGQAAGAAIDVFSEEPPGGDNPLLKAPHAILTPHLGASTREAQEKVGVEVAQQIAGYLRHGIVQSAVNAPALPPEEARALAPTLDLATRLGKLQAQLLSGNLKEIRIVYHGELPGRSTKPITTALISGFLGSLTDEPVNFVNAGVIAKKRGIAIVETRSHEDADFARLIEVTFATDAGERIVAGTVFGSKNPRIVRMDGFDFDAVPSGHILLVSNVDKAGVVGSLGSIMGRHGINIASMSLARDKPTGRALAIINVDSAVPHAVVSELSAQEHVLWVKTVHL